MGISQKQIIASCILLLLITTACAISFNKDNGLSEAEETLQALSAQTTADAIAAESEQSQQKIEDDTEQDTTPIEPESSPNHHNIVNPDRKRIAWHIRGLILTQY